MKNKFRYWHTPLVLEIKGIFGYKDEDIKLFTSIGSSTGLLCTHNKAYSEDRAVYNFICGGPLAMKLLVC